MGRTSSEYGSGASFVAKGRCLRNYGREDESDKRNRLQKTARHLPPNAYEEKVFDEIPPEWLPGLWRITCSAPWLKGEAMPVQGGALVLKTRAAGPARTASTFLSWWTPSLWP